MNKRTARVLSLVLLSLLLVVLLSSWALAARQRFLTRGRPHDLPGPNPHAAVPPYGINVDMLHWDQTQQQEALDRIAAAGFKWIKQPISWGDESSLEFWLETADGLCLKVVALLDGQAANDYAPPVDPQDFANWASDFAARYGDQIDYYQIWDEPNLHSHWGGAAANPADYAALLAAARQAILAADPAAVIIAAALAPTIESGAGNLSDVEYLEALYQLGADAHFEVAAGKPYGFDTGPEDRRVSSDLLNFSRLILLRKVMEKHGDSGAALWGGNFAWNALPAGWTGQPSLWGQTDVAKQALQTQAAYRRAAEEWPWLGVLFLENYAPAAPPNDPRWGFALLDQDLNPRSPLLETTFTDLIPAYQVPAADSPYQQYTGGWRFSPEYGADIGQTGDRIVVEFEGTDLGLHVRRGDYRAYFYVTVDGQAANVLPSDDRGAYLNLTSPDQSANDVVIIPVARHLAPGRHTAEIVAERGWDQWALVGFSSANLPDQRPFQRALAVLALAALVLAGGVVWTGRRAGWGKIGQRVSAALAALGRLGQCLLTAAVAGLFALSGWLTWLAPAGGPFRRLGEGPQSMILAAVAAVYFLSPWLILNILSGLALLLLIFWRLELGLMLVALTAPFYVYPKPLLGFRFSMVEMVLWITVAAFILKQITRRPRPDLRAWFPLTRHLFPLDYAVGFFLLAATFSLLFAQRLDVATNEWRVVVLEPVLFYGLLRLIKLDKSDVWRVVDSYVLGGLVVAVLGLIWYGAIVLFKLDWPLARLSIITAEQGLPRLRSIYGSPNNVGLYLGRIAPILLAVALTGRGRRRWFYGAALLPVVAAVFFSLSKGALALGLPVGLGAVLAWTAARRWGAKRAGELVEGQPRDDPGSSLDRGGFGQFSLPISRRLYPAGGLGRA